MSEDLEIEFPTADAVAHAIVASARVLGDDPLAAFDGMPHRFRAPAAKALSIFYPDVSAYRIGRMVGYQPASAKNSIRDAEKAGWWLEGGVVALEAAITALEAI